MLFDANHATDRLKGHALRNAHLRERALVRSQSAPPLSRAIVCLRAQTLGMTRLEFARKSGISRGTLRDLELGVHLPTRRVLQQLVGFCQKCRVNPEQIEELRRLYAGTGSTLGQFIARLELRAGSPRELARRVGISPATLWEYRRGNFPLPLALLRRLCAAVDENAEPGEALWHEAERERLGKRGYPPALAEFWVLCAREGYAERHLLKLGISTATARRMRYLELPAWEAVARAAALLCRDAQELASLRNLWLRGDQQQEHDRRNDFGAGLKKIREAKGISRRELADLFGIGGKKPARIIKYIEEDGFYSAKAYPAGLAAILVEDRSERQRLLDSWQRRRQQFHRRRRPEMRVDLRLARERYGLRLDQMEAILGYTSLEYQRIERGVTPLLETARARILQALENAGEARVAALLRERANRETRRYAWQAPPAMPAMVSLLAVREGGLIPLARFLRQAGLKGLWTGRLRAISQGKETPPWHTVEMIAKACRVTDLSEVRGDWEQRYRLQLQRECRSPLGVELQLLIAEVASTLRAFSPRLGFNYSVLVRDLQRINRDRPVKWFHVERILRAAGLPPGHERWQEIHALWYTAEERCKRTSSFVNPRPVSRSQSS